MWGCEKFYLQVFGQAFVVVTENKAIEMIFKNPNSTPPARIERGHLDLANLIFKSYIDQVNLTWPIFFRDIHVN